MESRFLSEEITIQFLNMKSQVIRNILNLIKKCDMLNIRIIDNSNNQLAIIFACHYPLLTFPHRVYNDTYQVYGHIHTLSDGSITGFDSDIKDKLLPNQYDVGVDQNDYTPVSYNQLISIFNKKHKN